MATRNDITGDTIQTKTSSQAYRDNWDAIFGKKTKVKEDVLDTYNDERLVSKFDKAAVEPTYAFNSHGTHAQ